MTTMIIQYIRHVGRIYDEGRDADPDDMFVNAEIYIQTRISDGDGSKQYHIIFADSTGDAVCDYKIRLSVLPVETWHDTYDEALKAANELIKAGDNES